MGYDRGDSFPFDWYRGKLFFDWSKSIGKLSPRSYPIQFERKWKYSFLSAHYMAISIKQQYDNYEFNYEIRQL